MALCWWVSQALQVTLILKLLPPPTQVLSWKLWGIDICFLIMLHLKTPPKYPSSQIIMTEKSQEKYMLRSYVLCSISYQMNSCRQKWSMRDVLEVEDSNVTA